MTMIASTTPVTHNPRIRAQNVINRLLEIGENPPYTHNPRIRAQNVINRLLEIGENPPYTMYVLYAAFLF